MTLNSQASELLLFWYRGKHYSSTAHRVFDEIPERNKLQPFDLYAESYNYLHWFCKEVPGRKD
ncbi:hypothetical protein LguiA_005431 [Lonicera macranthoides]